MKIMVIPDETQSRSGIQQLYAFLDSGQSLRAFRNDGFTGFPQQYPVPNDMLVASY